MLHCPPVKTAAHEITLNAAFEQLAFLGASWPAFHSLSCRSLCGGRSIPMGTTNSQVGYLSSWSPYSTWRHKHPEKEDPLIAVKKELLEACNARDGSFGLDIEFPIFVMMAKHH